MNYFSEGSLGGLIKKTKAARPRTYFPESRIVKWMLCVAAGLEELHTHIPPIVHRDIKPNNLLLKEETLHLADFGIAKVLTTSNNTQGIGTAKYMAPEQYESRYNTKVDMWAMGVVLFELLTLKSPSFHFVPLSEIIEKYRVNERYSQSIVTLMFDLLMNDPSHRPTATQAKQTLQGISFRFPIV